MKHKKHKTTKKGMHKMPNGKMMSDKEMENYHASRGKVKPMSALKKTLGGRY